MANVGQENVPTYTAFVSGVTDVGATAVQVLAGAGRTGVAYLRAAAANSGTVTIGASGVTSLGGFTLSAGEQSPPILLNDLSLLFAIASASGQKLEYFIQS